MTSTPKWVGEIGYGLCPEVQHAISKADMDFLNRVDEIRFRAGNPVGFISANQDYFLTREGIKTREEKIAIRTTQEEIAQTMNRFCNQSLYAREEELKNGYITISGGYRIGVSGRVHTKEQRIESFLYFSGICIRILREIKGCADTVMPYLFQDGTLQSTLIISAPMMGKTTLLRDIARQISDGGYSSTLQKVCIVDERSEIAGSVYGVAQLQVGKRTDILDGCPKAQGMMMALRSLSPSVLLTDELGGEEDAKSVFNAMYAGVKVIASVHGFGLEDIQGRNDIQHLVQSGAFKRYVVLRGKPGRVDGIYDADKRPLFLGGRDI